MNEKHVVSLELSKKLKEVGYPQEGGYFVWKEQDTGNWDIVEIFIEMAKTSPGDFAVAPLASELMERLPDSIRDYDLIVSKLDDEFFVYYERDGVAVREGFDFKDTNLCNALAKMYIYLAEIGGRRDDEIQRMDC